MTTAQTVITSPTFCCSGYFFLSANPLSPQHTMGRVYTLSSTRQTDYIQGSTFTYTFVWNGGVKKTPLSWKWVPGLNTFGYLCLICKGEAASSVNKCLLKTQLSCASWMKLSWNCNSNSTSQDSLLIPPVQECPCNVLGALADCSFHGFHSSWSKASIHPRELNGNIKMNSLPQFWDEQHCTGVDPGCKIFKWDYSKYI